MKYSKTFFIIILILTTGGIIGIRAFQYRAEGFLDSTVLDRFIKQVTFPFKILIISAEPPDTVLLISVQGVQVKQVDDTWGAPRPGGRTHDGQDIFAATGTPVYSATSGYILRITDKTIGGNSVFVIGPGGRRYYYTHFDAYAPDIYVGDKVLITTLLGFVGTTGNASSTPPHLHFGVYTSRGSIDPLPFLQDRATTTE